MNVAAAHRLPAPVRAVGRRLPRLPASIAFATGLNLTLRRKFPAEVLERLEGHTFAIVVEDAGMELLFRVRARRFVPVASAAEPVLRFRAVAWDYAALAAREADPDTLFFNRRLARRGRHRDRAAREEHARHDRHPAHARAPQAGDAHHRPGDALKARRERA